MTRWGRAIVEFRFYVRDYLRETKRTLFLHINLIILPFRLDKRLSALSDIYLGNSIGYGKIYRQKLAIHDKNIWIDLKKIERIRIEKLVRSFELIDRERIFIGVLPKVKFLLKSVHPPFLHRLVKRFSIKGTRLSATRSIPPLSRVVVVVVVLLLSFSRCSLENWFLRALPSSSYLHTGHVHYRWK